MCVETISKILLCLRLDRSGLNDARVVDQHIDRAEMMQARSDGFLNRAPVANVAGQADDLVG